MGISFIRFGPTGLPAPLCVCAVASLLVGCSGPDPVQGAIAPITTPFVIPARESLAHLERQRVDSFNTAMTQLTSAKMGEALDSIRKGLADDAPFGSADRKEMRKTLMAAVDLVDKERAAAQAHRYDDFPTAAATGFGSTLGMALSMTDKVLDVLVDSRSSGLAKAEEGLRTAGEYQYIQKLAGILVDMHQDGLEVCLYLGSPHLRLATFEQIRRVPENVRSTERVKGMLTDAWNREINGHNLEMMEAALKEMSIVKPPKSRVDETPTEKHLPPSGDSGGLQTPPSARDRGTEGGAP